MKNTRSFWNLTSLIAFAAFVFICIQLVKWSNGFVILVSFNTFDFLLVAIATFRLIHLFTYDKIFDFVRDFFHEEGREGDHAPTRIGSRVVYEMLECLWCTGIWSGVLALTIYSLGLWGQFVIIVLAAAGVGSLLQVISRSISKE